ncbi:DNA mismatch repair protein MutS [Desulfuromonas versatilis]|uniref:DNA mismatch repair protein MutS n=1 Tax=Desulfuromonas versatilis TaxID=2802975 RepID=A0ABM8HNQ2_9BACT|nr:Smr/MutS family protein [Desulfuromonas versatilis]BCR04496.1 DNA mismatch repair protein MutS [Desulfuromonas versatilis]
MSDRNKKDKDLNNNPFKALKGLSVSQPGKKSTSPATAEKSPSPRPAAAPPEQLSEEDLFAREMGLLGVTPKPEGEHSEPPPKAPPAPPAAGKPAQREPATEEELFLDSLGKMDRVFRDEFTQEDSSATPAAQGRRQRQLRRGKLVPEDQLDLHGMTRDEAGERVRYFLENSIYHGRRTVLVVTGRGLGSAGEPVLRAEVERLLGQELRELVLEWGRAPRQYGGEGALVVFLRGGRENH